MENWKPLATLARAVGVPEASARRYVHALAALVRSRRVGKAILYAPEVGEMLKAASDGFAAGLRREEVAEQVAARYGRVHDVVPGDDDVTTTPPATVDSTTMAALLPLLDRFVTALEVIAARLPLPGQDRPQDAPEPSKRPNPHGRAETSTNGPHIAPPVPHSRAEIVGEVLRLHGEGMGAGAIATRLRATGWPTTSGRGKWGKGAVRRILDKEGGK